MSKTAVEANEERGSDERKAKWDCLCKVQGGMSSSSTNPAPVASHSTRMPKKREGSAIEERGTIPGAAKQQDTTH